MTSTRYRRKLALVEARQVLGSVDGSAARELAVWCGGFQGGASEPGEIEVILTRKN